MITTDTGITASNEQSEYGNNRKGSRDYEQRRQACGSRHHEIYLSDPRKTAADKLKTVIRYPVK